MSRLVATIDRTATMLLGLLLIAGALLVVVWRFDWWSYLPQRSDTSAFNDVFAYGWWPWAETAAGVVLLALGLRWLWAHVPSRGVGELNLPDSGPTGRGRFHATAVASAAADELADAAGVRSAKGTVRRDRGQLVVDITATIDATANLTDLAPAADRVMAQLAQMINRNDVFGRVHLVVAGKTPTPRRVS